MLLLTPATRDIATVNPINSDSLEVSSISHGLATPPGISGPHSNSSLGINQDRLSVP